MNKMQCSKPTYYPTNISHISTGVDLRIGSSLRIGHFKVMYLVIRGPFLEIPVNLTGPKSEFENKVSRKVGCVVNSNEVHFVF